MIGHLKRVGEILHKSNLADNLLIIRLYKFVRPGTVIYDAMMREIGKVIEVFGPVRSPYARVIINEKEKKYVEELLRERAEFQKKEQPRNRFFCYIIQYEEERVRWRKMPRPRKGRVE